MASSSLNSTIQQININESFNDDDIDKSNLNAIDEGTRNHISYETFIVKNQNNLP